MKRYAIVMGLKLTAEKVSAYLPSNYKVLGSATINKPWGEEFVIVIEGRDSYGWTLDHYVIPRLGSGLMGCQEIDLSHPVMGQFNAF